MERWQGWEGLRATGEIFENWPNKKSDSDCCRMHPSTFFWLQIGAPENAQKWPKMGCISPRKITKIDPILPGPYLDPYITFLAQN